MWAGERQMFEKLAGIEARYQELTRLMAEHAAEYAKVAEYARERAEIEPVVAKFHAYRDLTGALEQARGMRADPDLELRNSRRARWRNSGSPGGIGKGPEGHAPPQGPAGCEDVILEIRAGTGGEEAALVCRRPVRLYSRYAERNGWKIEILSQTRPASAGSKRSSSR